MAGIYHYENILIMEVKMHIYVKRKGMLLKILREVKIKGIKNVSHIIENWHNLLRLYKSFRMTSWDLLIVNKKVSYDILNQIMSAVALKMVIVVQGKG